MKAPFPLSAAVVAQVCTALQVPALPLRETFDLAALRTELAEPSRGVRAVDIHKRRQRYSVGGCHAEMTELAADGRTTRTVYPRGLKRLLAWPA
jgi:exopolyphosphatase/guanosine-5'-triphosphate,3'-diphosphate pyrophosphatase